MWLHTLFILFEENQREREKQKKYWPLFTSFYFIVVSVLGDYYFVKRNFKKKKKCQ